MEKENFISGMLFRNLNHSLMKKKGFKPSKKLHCMKLQIDTTKSRVIELLEATLQLSNLDLVTSYVFKGEKAGTSKLMV